MAKAAAGLLAGMLLLSCLLAGCAAEEAPAVIDLEQQRAEFISMANNHAVDEPEGIRAETTVVTEGDFLISADCPVVEANETVSADLRSYVENETAAFQAEAQSMGPPDENTGLFTLLLTYRPYPVGTELLSIKFAKSVYTGKTDKKNHIESFVYNLATGERMDIGDVFDTGQPGSLTTLSGTVRQYLLENEIVRSNLQENLFEEGTSADAQNFSNFAVTPEGGISFFFNKGAVAPSEVGTLEVRIPLSEFDSILNPANKEILYGKTVDRGAGTAEEPVVEEPAAETPAETAPAEPVAVDMSEYPQFTRGEEFLQLMPLDGIDPINDKVIALTFDDGPAPSTPDLLACLKEYDSKATFFVVGDRVANDANYKDILQQTYDGGHEIANHTWSHQYPSEIGLEAALEEYTKANDAIEAVIGKRTLIDRPPGGYMTEELAQQIGREQIFWTVDTEDWAVKGQPDGADIVYRRIMDSAGDGEIILLHDLHPTSVQGAIRAIPELVEQGYKLVTVTQMIQIAKARGHEISYFWGKNTITHLEDTRAADGGATGQEPEE